MPEASGGRSSRTFAENMLSGFFLFSLIALVGWIYIEIRFPRRAWVRILSGLAAMGLIVSVISTSLWAYLDYVTGTQIYFLEAVQTDLQEKSVEEVREYLRVQIPKIATHRNNAAQMHRLLVERDLSELPVNNNK